MLDLSVLATGKGACYRAELRDAKLEGEFRIERDLRTPGIDEEGEFVAAVYAHAENRQRLGLYELQTRTCRAADDRAKASHDPVQEQLNASLRRSEQVGVTHACARLKNAVRRRAGRLH